MNSRLQRMTTLLILAKNSERQILNFSCMAQFHKKARICLRSIVHDSVWKQVASSIILPQVSERLISVTIMVALRPLTQF